MGLTHAFPDLAGAAGTLTPIEGAPPDLFDPPPGCRFAPRCPFAEARCRAAPPHAGAAGPDHTAACWRLTEADALREAAGRVETWAAMA
jgi:peptide/nickel transport system ATP-binding protein